LDKLGIYKFVYDSQLNLLFVFIREAAFYLNVRLNKTVDAARFVIIRERLCG